MPSLLSRRAQVLLEASLAPNTRLSYSGSMRRFEAWCLANNLLSLPAAPKTVAEYIAALYNEGFKASTIRTNIAGICAIHRDAEHPDPSESRLVHRVLQGAMRLKGMRPTRKAPTEMEDLDRILCAIPNTLVGLRDKAMLTLGFAGAMRRSEVVGIDVEDVTFTPDGATVLIGTSKTDPFSYGVMVAIPDGKTLRAATTLRTWLEAACITSGPVFRPIYNGHVIERRVHPTVGPRALKKYAEIAGFDPTLYSGHSLRAGFITEAANAGVDTLALMGHSRHRTTKQLREYVRKANLFKNHPGLSFL